MEVSSTRGALDDLIGDSRRLLFWVSAIAGTVLTAVVLVEWLRPFDIRMIPDPRTVAGLAVVGAGCAFVALLTSRMTLWVKVVAALFAAAALLATVGLAGLALLSGGRGVVWSAPVPGTGTSVVAIDAAGDVGDEVVLRGTLGPLPRERVLLDTAGCNVFLGETGTRSAQIDVTAVSSDCRSSGHYLVTIGSDDWSTTVERTQ